MCARSFNSTLFGWLVHMVFEGDTHSVHEGGMPKAKCIIVGNECGWMKLCHAQLLRLLVEKKALGLVGGLLYIDSYLGHLLHLQPLKFWGFYYCLSHPKLSAKYFSIIPTLKHWKLLQAFAHNQLCVQKVGFVMERITISHFIPLCIVTFRHGM